MQNTVLLILLTSQISINVFHVPCIAAVVCTCVCTSVHKHWFLQTDWPLIPNVFAPPLSGDFIHSWPQALSDSSLGCSAHEPMNGFCLTARSRGHTRHSHSCCIQKPCVTFSVVPVWSPLGTSCFMSDWDDMFFFFYISSSKTWGHRPKGKLKIRFCHRTQSLSLQICQWVVRND